jgi:hypothetical protein
MDELCAYGRSPVVACFIHSCTLPMRGTEILSTLLTRLRSSGLLARLDYLEIHNVGKPLDIDLSIVCSGVNLRVIEESEAEQYENVTLRALATFSASNPEARVLYLHTKGASYDEDHPLRNNVDVWTDVLMTCVIDYWATCIACLDYADVAGGLYWAYGWRNGSLARPHYAGNFWWVRCDYFSTLPFEELVEKYSAEFLLWAWEPRYVNLERYLPNQDASRGFYDTTAIGYRGRIARRAALLHALLNGMQDGQEPEILFGASELNSVIDDRWTTAEFSVGEPAVKAGGFHLPSMDYMRNQLFTDPCVGTRKMAQVRISGHDDVFIDGDGFWLSKTR